MYSVSDAYKVAVADSHRKSKMRGVLTVGSTVIDLDDNDILKNTVYVTNQCTNGNEFEYGCVYSGECGLTIKSAVDRYSLYNAELKLYWYLWTGAEWEEIPLGVFYVSEPNRINDKISIKALDSMTKLDVNVDEDTTGTLPQLMTYVAEKCGVELAQTVDDFALFPNGNVQYSVLEERVETYRDLLSYLCMVSACFATMDRFGKLRLVPYATESSLTLGKKQRFTNASFSDYTTSFSGIKARFIAEENYAPYEVGEKGNGLVLDMGDIPIVRGLPETKYAVLTAVYDVLKNVSYTPFELETLGNPAIDLGDYVNNEDVGKDSNSYTSPITYYYWTYRGKHKLRAVGGNPKLANVKTREDRHLSSLEEAISTKTIVVKNYRNSDAIEFSDKETEIAYINYAAAEKSEPIFLLTVRLKTDRDGVLVLQFYNDDIIDEDRTYRKYLDRGEHFVSLSDIYHVQNNTRHMISIMAHMEYVESDIRVQQSDIQTHKNFLTALSETGATVTDNVVSFPDYDIAEIDTTVANATIKKGEVVAILYGQGIAGNGKWDGTINFNEDVGVIKFNSSLSFNKESIEEIINPSLQTPVGGSIYENIGVVPFGGNISFVNVDERIGFGNTFKDYVFNVENANLYDYDKYITTNNNMFSLKTIYKYDSVEEKIDIGNMCSVAIDYTGLTVESVVVENG